jgi:gas vesicle protein
MSQEDNSSSVTPMLLSFLAGFAVGAVVVALTTPKSGPELRGDLKDASAKAKRRAADLARGAAETWEDLKERTRLAATDLKRGLADSVKDLKQPARAAQDPTRKEV